MPKWSDRLPVAPNGDVVSSRPNAPLVDISPEIPVSAPVASKPGTTPDPRIPATVHPPEAKSKHIETLEINPIPTPDGIRYTITNIGGMSSYIVVLVHRTSNTAYTIKAKDREGFLPVPGISKLRGKWDALLIVDMEVAHRSEVELELTMEWLADAVGKANIFFGPSDGPLDRLGAVNFTPYPKKHSIPSNSEDVAICIMMPNLPEDLPPNAKMTVQILRPGTAGIYYRTETDVLSYVGYLLKVSQYLPCVEPGDWTVLVQIGSKVIGTESIKITKVSGRASVTKTENQVEEFHARIAG